MPTVGKKPLQLVFPYLEATSLQTRTKPQKFSKDELWFYILKGLFLKLKINLVIIFASKTLFPKFLHQVLFTSFSVDYAMNPMTETSC